MFSNGFIFRKAEKKKEIFDVSNLGGILLIQ